MNNGQRENNGKRKGKAILAGSLVAVGLLSLGVYWQYATIRKNYKLPDGGINYG